jgi:anti-sigma factor RsiW
MKCAEVRSWLSRKVDGELMDFENRELEEHLAQCAGCTREYRLLMFPHQVAEATPSFAPSPFFYQKLRARIESEIQWTAEWQPLWGLARRMIPALAGITLAILSVFAYHELRAPEDDLQRAYNRIFISESLPHQMIVSEQEEITNENVLNIVAEREFNNLLNMSTK